MRIKTSVAARLALLKMTKDVETRWGKRAGNRVVSDYEKLLHQLLDHPEMGPIHIEALDLRRIAVNRHFSILYTVEPGVVQIQHLWIHAMQQPEGFELEDSTYTFSPLPQSHYLRSENPEYGRCRHYHGQQIGLARDATGGRCAA